MTSSQPPIESKSGAFPATRWSVVLGAAGKDGKRATSELETLCRTYWSPIYAYVRRKGHGRHDAQDLTQAFFARVLAGGFLENADREKGRFRTYLLTSLKRFLVTEWEHSRAQKRGEGKAAVPIDTDLAERMFSADGGGSVAPDQHYEKRCAIALLDAAFEELRREFVEAGKSAKFEQLKPWLSADRGDIPYREIADSMGEDAATVRVTVHRFRKRYRELFRQQVLQTLASPEDLDDEMRFLRRALGG